MEDATPPLHTRFPCSFGVIWANSVLDKQDQNGGRGGGKGRKKASASVKATKKKVIDVPDSDLSSACATGAPKATGKLLLFYANFV